ncbi:hypothetical protein IPJ91_00370 [bacterium]|nr:MAG: hypothetical protein IPJ91_00370 [bacterium]
MSKLNQTQKISIYLAVSLGLAIVYPVITKNSFGFIRSTAWLSILFLFLTLVPINIVKTIQNPKLKKFVSVLASNRRVFGIVSGSIALIHSSFTIWQKYDFKLINLLTRETLPGSLANLIMLLMLSTSLFSVQRKFRNWKMLHSIVWLLVPLVFVHALLSEIYFVDVFSWIMFALIGFLLLLGVFKKFLKSESRDYLRDLVLFLIGTLVSISVFLFVK